LNSQSIFVDEFYKGAQLLCPRATCLLRTPLSLTSRTSRSRLTRRHVIGPLAKYEIDSDTRRAGLNA